MYKQGVVSHHIMIYPKILRTSLGAQVSYNKKYSMENRHKL